MDDLEWMIALTQYKREKKNKGKLNISFITLMTKTNINSITLITKTFDTKVW